MDASKNIALETLENTPLTRKELFFVIDLFAKLDPLPKSEWLTPIFVKIQEKRTKRISPY
jgi:hypothetical protein